MKRLAILLSLITLAACSTPLPPAPVTAAPQAAAPAAPAAAPTAPARSVALVNAPSPMQTFERMESSLDRNSIYFDYDKSAVRPVADSVIELHARALEKYPGDHLTLQGNCDERGSSEYNLALGQRRADAVKERLVLLGIPAARIETISFGKEKPRETCHEEKCWSENRRADFVDTWKPQQVSSR